MTENATSTDMNTPATSLTDKEPEQAANEATAGTQSNLD